MKTGLDLVHETVMNLDSRTIYLNEKQIRNFMDVLEGAPKMPPGSIEINRKDIAAKITGMEAR
jgi:hypothetical protein